MVIQELVLGKSVKREIGYDDVHRYRVFIEADQCMHAIVDQGGFDLAITVSGPDGKQIREFDSRWKGTEPITVISTADGFYTLAIRPVQNLSSHQRYTISIKELRKKTRQDEIWIAAELASTDGKRLLTHGTVDSLRNAKSSFEEALTQWRNLANRSGEGQALNSIGYVTMNLGESKKALSLLDQALLLRRTIRDGLGEAETLLNLGAACSFLGDKRKALEHYASSLAICRELADSSGEAVALSNMGVVYNDLGERQIALECLTEALELHRANRDRWGEAMALNGLGTLYSWLGETESALRLFNQALPLYQLLNHRQGEGTTLNNIGFIWYRLGDTSKAHQFYNRALSVFRDSGNRWGEAYTLTNIGKLCADLEQHQEALKFFNIALSLRREVGDLRGEAVTLHSIGVASDSLGNSPEARQYYDQALSLTRRVGDRASEANVLHTLAHYERKRGDLVTARNLFEAAIDIVESLRVKIHSADLRTSYFASVQTCFESYIDLLMTLHQHDPSGGYDALALQASERARARSLLEGLIEIQAEIRKDVDSELVQREGDLERQINTLSERQMKLLDRKQIGEQTAPQMKQLEALLAEHREVQWKIRTQSTSYASLRLPQPVTLDEIQQQLLDQDTLLLDYFLGEERSFLWAVSTDSIHTDELPKRRHIEEIARCVHQLMARWSVDSRSASRQACEAEFSAAASGLSRMILGPVASLLGGKRLTIVADGALQYVPFGALPIPGACSNEGRDIPYVPLLKHHEIVHLPSASTLAVMRTQLAGRKPAPKTAATFADPVFDRGDFRVKKDKNHNRRRPRSKMGLIGKAGVEDFAAVLRGAGMSNRLSRLHRLAFSRREADKIEAAVPPGSGLKLVGFEATRSAATSPEIGNYRFVHFATHGLINSIHPELSAVVLSLVDEHGRRRDGFLTLLDVYNLNLCADIVVLSACQTALGKEIKGEGLIGLTRGFMYAGAARVVASLWKVDDEATSELMGMFYTSMLGDKPLPPAAALRASQLAIFKERRWRSPYYWAGFVIQGDWK